MGVLRVIEFLSLSNRKASELEDEVQPSSNLSFSYNGSVTLKIK